MLNHFLAPTPTVAASLAYDCLKSVPLRKDAAVELVDSMLPYFEWQSDYEYKKHPPRGYFWPGYDAVANLAQVRANILGDKYDGEYEFQTDLQTLVFAPGMDGHFFFFGDILTRALCFKRSVSLVSISEDGRSLPVIKVTGEFGFSEQPERC